VGETRSSPPAGKQTFSDFLNLFIFNNRYSLGTVIKAMQDKGLFQSLAEPNLIATNGRKPASLPAVKYPYPVVQPGSGGNADHDPVQGIRHPPDLHADRGSAARWST